MTLCKLIDVFSKSFEFGFGAHNVDIFEIFPKPIVQINGVPCLTKIQQVLVSIDQKLRFYRGGVLSVKLSVLTSIDIIVLIYGIDRC